MSKKTIPVSLVVNDQAALVVGGGAVAAQKVRWLRKCGVPVEVLALSFGDELRQLAEAGDVTLMEGGYAGQAAGYALVIGAAGNASCNRAVRRAAMDANVPVNIVDEPELCTFFVPATVARGPLKVAISTDGASPALAARLRRELEGFVPSAYGVLLPLLETARDQVRERVTDGGQRAAILKHLASDTVMGRLLDAPPGEREERMNAAVEDAIGALPAVGTVYLVGAGPGDPGLFTLKGLRSLMGADAVLHDGLANPALLEALGDDVEIHDASKRAGCAIRTQDQVNALLVELATAGKNVCRLKGGDPCVFGRGGDEALHLAANGIPFEIVSGVTSPVAVAAYAGIPITHRDHASYFQVVTGHESPEKTESRVNWGDLGAGGGTVVFLMGAGRLSEIADKLVAHGRAPATPLAIISKGTLPGQKVFETTLADAANEQFEKTMAFERPALIVVGEVVSLRKELSWFGGQN